MRVLVQFRSSPQVHSALLAGEAMPAFAAESMAAAGEGAAGLVGTGGPITGLSVDTAYTPVQVPTPRAARPGVSAFRFSQPVSFSTAPEEATYVVRGSIPDDPERQRDALSEAQRHPEVVGIFSDPTVQTSLVCPGSPAVGNDQDVATLLGVKALDDEGLDGHGVPLAIVDTGINIAFLKSKGRDPRYSIPRSWTPQGVETKPGRHPVDHQGNYSDNPAHPFNVIVASLADAGADILFAAGNCGRDCPDGRCGFGDAQPICGANSHPSVTSVAGIDTKKRRVGYSSQGPGRLSAAKPDVSCYTHFTGSDVFHGPDSGTSAACPVAAGVVAAIRTHHSPSQLLPAELRTLVAKTATDLGGTGFDNDFGWGALDGTAMVASLANVRRRRPRHDA